MHGRTHVHTIYPYKNKQPFLAFHCWFVQKVCIPCQFVLFSLPLVVNQQDLYCTPRGGTNIICNFYTGILEYHNALPECIVKTGKGWHQCLLDMSQSSNESLYNMTQEGGEGKQNI